MHGSLKHAVALQNRVALFFVPLCFVNIQNNNNNNNMNVPSLLNSPSLDDSSRSFDSSRSSLFSMSSSSSSLTSSPWRKNKSRQQKSTRRRKVSGGVTFAPLHQQESFNFILDRSEFTQEEVEACWWGSHELQEIQIIKEKSSNIPENDDDDDGGGGGGRCCSREYVRYMLQQQDELKRLGIDDPFMGLSVISRSCSKKSRKDAQQRAIQHHAECM